MYNNVKYFKYKNKYFQLKKKIQLGGTIDLSDVATFEEFINNPESNVTTLIINFNINEDEMKLLANKNGITNLTFNHDQLLDASIFKELKSLTIGNNYNHPLDLTKNENLEFLAVGNNYNHPLDLTKNENLKYLTIGENFNQNLDLSNNVLLQQLIINNKLNKEIKFPSSYRIIDKKAS
jgi:hypothetical protein